MKRAGTAATQGQEIYELTQKVYDSKTQVWRGLTTAHRGAAVEVYAVEGARFGKLIDTSTVEVDAAVRQIEEALSRVA